MKCRVKKKCISGIDVLYLESDLLRVSILAGKGGEIYEMIYKPLEMDILLKTPGRLTQYEGRDLSRERLTWYSELFTGGWIDVLPGMAIYKDINVTMEAAGIAATMPWNYEIVSECGESAAVRLFVDLPVVPISVEKTITVKQGDARLLVSERIINKGDAPICFTWVQHSAFGGSFLDEDVEIILPDHQLGMPMRATPPEVEGHDLRVPLPRGAEANVFITLRELSEYRFALRNHKKGIEVIMDWDGEAFPCLRCWYRSSKDIYTVALEPGNYYASSFDDTFKIGCHATLEPGQSMEAWVGCGIYTA